MNVHPLMILVVTLLERAERHRLAVLGDRAALIAEFAKQGVEGATRELRESNPSVH